MCPGNQNKAKVFMEVPETFIICASYRGTDYMDLLDEFMKEYIGRTRQGIRNSEVTFNSSGEMTAIKQLKKKKI